MMYTISKQFAFSASHTLTGLPDGHPCSRVHGHNYVVALTLSREGVDAGGFVVDYRALAPFKEYLDARFDHRHLNDVLDGNPTAENLARHFFEWARARWPEVCAVRVSETERTWAEYTA